MDIRRLGLPLALILSLALFFPVGAFAWSNGSAGFGTHDWCVYEANRLADANGSGWLNVDVAMASSSDPDYVLHDTYHHVYDVWGSTYGDSPTRVLAVWNQIIAAKNSGDYTEASRLFGLLSHYYSDTCNPLHTDQTAAEDAVHSSYETAIDSLTDTKSENSGWVVADGLQVVSDPEQATINAAAAGHADYTALVNGYTSGGTAGVSAITQRSLNRAVNGLADMIETLEIGSLDSPVGDSTNKFTRLAGASRFDVGVAIASAGFPDWASVTDVVVASGDDRAAADPLAAASLCWAYDAPLLLVSSAAVPSSVQNALAEIVAANPGVVVHVVGGPGSVPDARLDQMRGIVGQSQVERLPYGDRYATAASIAARAATVASERGKTVPSVALIANGADSTKFFDALALSAISAQTGAPILLVRADAVPPATLGSLANMAPGEVYVAGGTGSVSSAVAQTVKADERWAGATRYDTAILVADAAIGRGWLSATSVGLAAKLPDALTGGAFIGRRGGPLLVNGSTAVTGPTGEWVHANNSEIMQGYIFGGTGSLSDGVMTGLNHLADPNYVVPATPPVLTTVRAAVSNAYPNGGSVTVDVTALDQRGDPIEGASVNTVWHYKTTAPSQSDYTGADGIASITRSIGNATVGYRVVVNCTVTYGGVTKYTSTAFTPQ